MTVPVRKNMVALTVTDEPVYEVIGDLDGTPIFLGRMVRNLLRGGFDTSHKEGSWPDGSWSWIPSEERAIRRMVEHKGL